MIEELRFPENFLWGSAISAYQVEGNNKNNDWWDFEQIPGNIKNNEKSGEACNHYNLYDSDYELLSNLGQNAHRTGIEWSRIFPTENEIDDEEIEHYHRVFSSQKKYNLTSFITIHHFTVPKWFRDKGGFLKTKNLKFFNHYCETLAKNFPEVEFWNTINEPNVYSSMAYLSRLYPPGKRSLFKFFKVTKNILFAHAIAYRELKKHNPNSQVGIVANVPYFRDKYYKNLWKKLLGTYIDKAFNQTKFDVISQGKVPFIPFLKKRWLKDSTDFIGFNFYNAVSLRYKFGIPVDLDEALPNERTTQMGWGIHPEEFYSQIQRVHTEFKDKPIYITENGIATLDDDFRKEFIIKHLKQVHKAIKEGIDIRGFFYWSSIDNWEWMDGFEPRFGLIGINYATQERIVRDSAKMYGEIAKRNQITKELLEKYRINL